MTRTAETGESCLRVPAFIFNKCYLYDEHQSFSDERPQLSKRPFFEHTKIGLGVNRFFTRNQGVGKAIMKALIAKLPKDSTILIFAAPGKQDFYRKFGFGKLKTGMGLFPDPERSRANGYPE